MNAGDTAPNRTRLAELDRAIARLRGQYDVLMNAFKFDEARALVPAIEATERERAAVAARLPAEAGHQPKPYVVIPGRRRR
ncbi:MAG TPA: hypothetical protein VFQ90_03075 [Stellaceae bacterium]|jgi:hypothetical protein|nr:hypothetical protein [Stellaceae bacterium]